MCIEWPQPTDLYQPPAPPGGAAPDAPTLVIAGELDDVTSATEAAAVAAAFPRAQLRVVRNAGHIPSLYGGRYPARDWVREFLAAPLSAGRPGRRLSRPRPALPSSIG